MKAKATLLLVEDDSYIATLLGSHLGQAGLSVVSARSLESAAKLFAAREFQLVLMDLGLPDGDGKDLIRWLRRSSDVPLIVISARQQEQEKVQCLDLGADDYLAKPFGMDELMARIRVAMRHAGAMQLRERQVRVGDLQIDLQQERVSLAGDEVHLTRIESRLLLMLAEVPGRVVTHRQLLQRVWGPEYIEHTHYLRIHMGRLRSKIEAEPANPRYVRTEPGVGYRLSEK